MSIKLKLLISLCILETVLILFVLAVVSNRFQHGIRQQTQVVADTVVGHQLEMLQGHLNVLQLLYKEDQKNCVRAIDLVSGNSSAVAAVEESDLNQLSWFLKNAVETTATDLFVVYDLEGRVISSQPSVADAPYSREEFVASPLGQSVRRIAAEDDAWAAGAVSGVIRLSARYLRAHQLESAGATSLCCAAGQVLVDDFGDPIGFCIALKRLNGYCPPLEELRRVSGSAAALCLDGEAVAWAGFGDGASSGTAPTLTRAGEAAAGTPGKLELLHDGVRYIAATAPVTDPLGTPVAELCVAVPENLVLGAIDGLTVASRDSLTEIQGGIMLVGCAVLLVFLGLAAVIASRLIVVPLGRVVAGLHAMAKGEADLSQELPENSRDEVGQLAWNFNRFLERMRTSVQRSRDIARDVGSSVATIQASAQAVHSGAQSQSANLEASHRSVLAIGEGAASIEERTRTLVGATDNNSAATQQMGATAQQIAAKMDDLFQLVDQVSSSIHQMSSVSGQVSSSVETLAATAQETAASIAEMNHNIDQVGRSAERTGSVAEDAARDALSGKQAVDATVAGVESFSHMVEDSTMVISTLAVRCREIGGILTTISDIAEQTNLLALNASIIAAQAGRHGTGFGVVAQEIKTLAASTKASAKEITGIVHGLQAAADQALEASESGRSQILEEVERAREAGSRLDRILVSSEESRGQAAEIARSTQEQAEASRQITAAVDRVADMLGQIAAAVQEQTEGYRGLAGASDSMREIASQVKIGTDEQATGSGQIAESMEQVRALLDEIDSSTREQTSRSQEVLASVASALEIAQQNATLSADFDAAVATLTRQAETLQQEVSAFKT